MTRIPYSERVENLIELRPDWSDISKYSGRAVVEATFS